MMYLPLDQLIKNMPKPANAQDLMSNSDISRLTDQVLREVRARQSNTSSVRREGR